MSSTLALLFGLGACAKTETKTAAASASVLSEEPSADGLVEQTVDINGDGKADVFNYYRERNGAPRLLVRKETDLNWDGKVDVRTWFNETAEIEKEEMDGDFDSRVDWVDHYQGGRRVMSEVDTDWNGLFDLFKYYEGQRVRRKESDTNADGKIDFWEYFDDAGKVIRTGKDVDGDGVMDVRQE
jgi:hypothetical protein